MASNDAQPSSEINQGLTEPDIKSEISIDIDDEPSTSYSAMEELEDVIQMDVDDNETINEIIDDLCNLKIRINTTPEGITELSVDSTDADDGEEVTWSSEEVSNFLEYKIREYLKDSEVNKLMKLYKRSVELKKILQEKNAEYLKIQKLMEMIFRNQEKFLRKVGILPKIPMYSRGVSVDLPFLPPSASLKLPSNPVPKPKPTPSPSPAASNSANSSSSKSTAGIECIDLTDDLEGPNKSQKGSGTSGGAVHPAPLPPRPYYNQVDNILKIPPRPRLKVNGDPQGIILQWDLPAIYNAKVHEQVVAYEIFGYQVQPLPKSSVSPLLWKKIGTVKAMTLPMACTLTQFQEGHKYFFAIRALDKHKRCSHFSEALSIVYNSQNKGGKIAK